jgi:CubicO group peptidase (beta-lactamase class C family)
MIFTSAYSTIYMKHRKSLITVTLFVLGLALRGNLRAQTTYFPPNTGTWETINPQSLGWCSSNIDSLYNYLNQKNTKAFLILKDGKIVLEKYFGNFTQDSIWYWASAGKTLTAFTVGLAQQDGLLKLSDPSNKYLGAGWSSLSSAREDSIKVWHHLTMTTGLDDAGADPDCTDPNCLTYKAAAGSRWAYHNAPYTLLDKVIEGATGGNLNVYMAKKFTTSVGMKGLFVKTGYLNVYFSTARTMARFGLLLLNKGVWNGTVIMSDTQYFRQQTNSSQTLNPSYGYLTWLNGKSAFMVPGSQIRFPGSLNPDAPNDMICAWGKNGQYINVVPSQKLVLIRMGNAPGGSGASAMAVGFNNDIWKYVNRLPCSAATDMVSKPEPLVYPNPTTAGGNISISTPLVQLPVLMDLSGREIAILFKNPSQNASYTLPNSLTPGLYVLRLNTSQGILDHRLLVE